MDESMESGLAELFSGLSLLEDALASGIILRKPDPALLARLREAEDAAIRDESAPPLQENPESMASLEARARTCQNCGLSAGRKNVVFGQGVSTPLVLVVGEGPGAEEDRQGLPFVGASGKLLDKMLASIGLSREKNCYIANIVKCRPPENREPAPDERSACLPYLESQIRVLAPAAILCAGRTAAQSLLATTDGINRLRGKEFFYKGIPLVATYHPSALLRDDSLKRPAWEDLKRLRALLPSEASNET